jgi:hypothetical protein
MFMCGLPQAHAAGVEHGKAVQQCRIYWNQQ